MSVKQKQHEARLQIQRCFRELECMYLVRPQPLAYVLGAVAGIHSAIAVTFPGPTPERTAAFEELERLREELVDRLFPGTKTS